VKLVVTRLVDSIKVSGPSGLIPGASATLSAEINPSTASNKGIIWSSDNEAAFKVDKKGVVTAVEGAEIGATATITLTAADGGGAQGSITIEIRQPVQQITLSYDGNDVTGTTLTLDKGVGSIQLSAVALPDGVPQDFKWSSSKGDYASVDKDGLVKLKKKGTTTITATAKDGSGVKATVKITVQ
jgi:uncharacterized protein YjdB